MEDTMEGPPIKRKLFSNKSLCNIRAALRRGQNDLFIEESSGSNPDLKSTLARQRFARMGLAQNLSSASSGDLSDLIPAQRAISEPRILGKLHKQPLNVLYPSLDGLELLRTLGTGSFGRVRLVRCLSTGQFLALKALKKADVVRMNQLRHIANEKDILASIHHPFIVDLHAVYSDATRVYMLMGYVPGGELFHHLQKAPRRRLPAPAACFYAASVLLALEYLHDRNIVYRDLKPENILLDTTGYIKLADFGFAKVMEEDRTYTMCGTPEYIAPEMIQMLGHDRAVDYWSLGVLIYEMLAGCPPFMAGQSAGQPGSRGATLDTYRRIIGGKLEFPAHITLPAKDLIRRLLAADPAARLGRGANGAQEVKDHPLFQRLDWDALLRRELPAPIVPEVLRDGDASNFGLYSESVDAEVPPASPHDTEAADSFFRDWLHSAAEQGGGATPGTGAQWFGADAKTPTGQPPIALGGRKSELSSSNDSSLFRLFPGGAPSPLTRGSLLQFTDLAALHIDDVASRSAFARPSLDSMAHDEQEAQENDNEFQDLFPMTSVFAQGSWTEELQQQQQRKDARNANSILTAASSMASIGTAVSLDTD